jgi:8-oxo-dGTP pyrophosphatase MutT (NUDIX family)
LEQAWWFYEDFMADVNDALPHFKQLKTFAERVFSHCPLLSKSNSQFTELFNNFSMYKSQIPVCGCIMLNPEMTKAVLVCTWKGKSWGFPRGKINENEDALTCAVREVYEECGFDALPHCKEEDQLVVIEECKAIKLFIAANVPESTAFAPQTRKEISDVAFFGFDELPRSTYGVYPFIPKLKRWIAMHQTNRKKGRGGAAAGAGAQGQGQGPKSSPKTILTKSTSGGALQLKVPSPAYLPFFPHSSPFLSVPSSFHF